MDIGQVRTETAVMADTLYEMLSLIEKGFMEHRQEFLAGALRKEQSINDAERALTQEVLALSKAKTDDAFRRELVAVEQIVETLERMGDEAASLIERIEMKNAEHLLFSELGVTQYNETFAAMKRSVEMMREYMKRRDAALRERVIDNGFQVKALVERYRQEHTDRLIKGICTPMAANMFFDMLDFTGNIARHASTIVKTL